MGGGVADLRQLLVLRIGVETMDRLAVGEAEHDDAMGHEVTFVHLGVAAAGQILAAVSFDEIADSSSVCTECLRVVHVEVDNEIGAHRAGWYRHASASPITARLDSERQDAIRRVLAKG